MEKELNPKEKAKELFDELYLLVDKHNDDNYNDNMNQKFNAKEACFIVANQILDVLSVGNLYMEQGESNSPTSNEYWIEVIKEIELINH